MEHKNGIQYDVGILREAAVVEGCFAKPNGVRPDQILPVRRRM